ncbi:MAG: DUF4249 domain-containing protein [Prevotellaceae bacterium]|jgi:hypothetical protein|nr:DUF4249 domain-containing protein [Prevotellaceae bacterium]
MKTIYKYITALFIAAFLCSCENTIEFDGEAGKPKLVLHCFLYSGEPIMLTLQTGKFFLSNERIKPVRNATVQVYCNDQFIETMKIPNDNDYMHQYFGNFRPRPGDKVSLKVSAPNFEPVDCSTVMPQPPVIQKVDYTGEVKRDFYIFERFDEINNIMVQDTMYQFDENYDMICHISDPGNIRNYYGFSGTHYVFCYEDGSKESSPININSNDIVFGIEESELFDSQENRHKIFSDELFNGKVYQLKFDYNYTFFNATNNTHSYYQPYIKSRECHVRLYSITEEHYLYLRTLEASGNDSFFTEPVQIYSNVNGGIGILAACTSTDYVIQMPVK